MSVWSTIYSDSYYILVILVKCEDLDQYSSLSDLKYTVNTVL